MVDLLQESDKEPGKFNRGWIPIWSLLQQETARFCRASVQTLVTPVINSLLYFLVFGVNLGDNLAILQTHSYLEFLVPGLVILGILNNSYQNSSSSILISKFHGSFEDFKIVPFKPYQIIWGMGIASILRGIIVGGITGVLGVIFLWYYNDGRMIEIFSWPLVMYYALTAGFLFGALGICVGFLSKTFEEITAVSSFILLPLIYLGGIFFPLETIAPFWQKVSLYNPLVYYINGFRYAVLGIGDIPNSTNMMVVGASLVGVYFFANYCIIHGNYRRW